MREVERRFTPEFRNRIDEIVVFQPLTKSEVHQIAVQQVGKIAQTLGRSNRTLHVTDEALERLVDEGYSLAYGARFLKRTIEERIKLPISQRWNEGRSFNVDVRDGGLEISVEEGGASLSGLAATA